MASAWLNFRGGWMASRVSHAPYIRLRDFSIVRICAIRTAGGWETKKVFATRCSGSHMLEVSCAAVEVVGSTGVRTCVY